MSGRANSLLARGMAFSKEVAAAYQQERIGEVAGMLAFSGMLTVFPFLLCLVALLGLFVEPAAAASLVEQLDRIVPGEITAILRERLTALAGNGHVQILTIGGLITVLSASNGMVALLRALNRAYGVAERRSRWHIRGIAFEMTFLSALLTLLAVIIALAAPAIAGWLPPPWPTIVRWARVPAAGLLMLVQAILVYERLPCLDKQHRRIVPGALVGVGVWLVASLAFSRWLSGLKRYEVIYGALGGAVVLLLWMWMSAHAVLFGATVNAVLGRRRAAASGAPG